MADAKLTALTAAGALTAADLFYASQGGASRKVTGAQLLALVGTAYVPLAGGTMTGALTIASGTLTASAPALNITQTWTAGATFTSALVNVTDTSSNVNSLLQDWQIAGSTVARLRKDGTLFLSGGISAGGSGFFSGLVIGGFADLFVHRDAAGVLAVRNGTNAQTLRVYGTYTDASNYERLTLSTTAGSSVNIAAETLGTGGDNLDIVLTPAGTGVVKLYNGLTLMSGGISATGAGIVGSFFQTANAGSYVMGNDIGLARNAAGVFEVNSTVAGTYRDLKLRNLIQTEYSQMTEMTAPSAPATNSVRIYAEDNGSGKTRLMALFATGSAVQLGIEP